MGGTLIARSIIGILLLLFAAITAIIAIVTLVLFPNLNDVLKIGFLAWIFCAAFLVIPAITQLIDGYRALFASLILYIGLFLFYKWLFPVISFSWVIFTSILFVFITSGGVIVDALKVKFIAGYQSNAQINISTECIDALYDFFLLQQRAYFSIPIGFIIGILAALFSALSSAQILFLSFKATLGTAIIFLFFILIKSFLIAFSSFIKQEKSEKSKVTIPFLTIKSLASYGVSPFDLTIISDTLKVDIGIALTEIRKIYFYYNLLNGIILSTLVYMLISILSIDLTNVQIGFLFLVLTFVFSQLPYSIGQFKTQAILIKGKEGAAKQDMQENLDKYLPLFPRFTVLISLFSGFAGGVLSKVIEELLKGLIKTGG